MPFFGEIRIFAGNFPPSGWAFCNGQLLSIAENDTLFQLIGTTYGGDGNETFAVPDLRGRVPLHPGTSPSDGVTYQQGEMAGTETVTLTPAQLPGHFHPVTGPVYIPTLGENPGKVFVPDNNATAITNGLQVYSTTKHATNRLAPLVVSPLSGGNMMTVQPAGGSQPKENMQPYLVLNFIISLTGTYPQPF
ncbi:MAG TPA: tail fiber protein [Chitinophaga sp.]